MIKITNLSKYFGELKVLEKVSLEIADGSSLAVIGPSGCGKSTLLKLINRLDEPTAGRIMVGDKDVTALNEEGLIELRKNVGMIFQTSALFDSMNVYENVAFALHQHTKKSEGEIRQIVRKKLKMVDLEGTEELMPSELSGGMQRRVCIARALAFDPQIILYDEPTTGLDPITSVTIEDLMIKLSRELKVTSILVTHVLQTVYRVAERVLMLSDGQLIEIGGPDDVKRTNDPVVKKFITGGL
ncbi:MAG: ABC transporter ATP-binding protein [Candidatus Margulisbacteria bacterium]|nr:ABC transporter ATP-binding protein [Candidatus Margulisiibacteriota bacterium]